MRRRPEARPHVVRGVPGQFLAVALQVPLLVAPRVVGVRLLEADLAQPVHHRRSGEGLGQPDGLGVIQGDVTDQPLPELDRLGVWVVHPEDPDAVVDPHLDDPADLGVNALRVVVEIQRVDVLVLLRRILRERDGAVVAGGEPFRVASPRGGPARIATRGPTPPPGRAHGPWRRRHRNRRTCRARDGWRRARPRRRRSRTAIPGRARRRSVCCSGPCG